MEATKEGEEEKKTEDKPEPTFKELTNPSRVTVLQEKVVRFDQGSRFVPIATSGSSDITREVSSFSATPSRAKRSRTCRLNSSPQSPRPLPKRTTTSRRLPKTLNSIRRTKSEDFRLVTHTQSHHVSPHLSPSVPSVPSLVRPRPRERADDRSTRASASQTRIRLSRTRPPRARESFRPPRARARDACPPSRRDVHRFARNDFHHVAHDRSRGVDVRVSRSRSRSRRSIQRVRLRRGEERAGGALPPSGVQVETPRCRVPLWRSSCAAWLAPIPRLCTDTRRTGSRRKISGRAMIRRLSSCRARSWRWRRWGIV